MRIHSLACTSLHPPFERLLTGRGSLFARSRMVCHCWLIETPAHGLVLVDTGLGEAEIREPEKNLPRSSLPMLSPTRDVSETAVARIRALGFSPRDVRHLILTHFDLDHAGGLSAFPEASVHLLRREHEAAMQRPSFRERLRYLPSQWAHGPRFVPYDVEGERWNDLPCVRGLRGLPPEILLVPLIGHTRGHAGVAVEGAEGPRLHAGDAFFHRATVEQDAPELPLGIRLFEDGNAIERASMHANKVRLRALVREGRARVVCSHDPVQQSAFAAELHRSESR